jgi:hypothetical protein
VQMPRARLTVLGLVMAMSIAGCGSSGPSVGAPAGTSAAARTACASIAEGSSVNDEAACAQGYDAAKAGKSVEKSCDSVGFGAVTETNNINDCQIGWADVDVAGSAAAASPSAAARTACASIAEGSSVNDEAACAQGYDAAKAGKSLEQSCDSIGFGAVTETNNIKDCEIGWAVS